jgi:hypothetical protein
MSAHASSEHDVTSIYQQALGAEFERLHPQIQRRFGFCSSDNVACVGRGVMDEVWHGAPYTLPFLVLGAWRSIMFPDRGQHVPFTIENYAYRDRFGRETMTWIRSFALAQPRRFDATMIYSDRRGRIVDYLGTHQHLAVDIYPSVDERGGLCLRSGAQRFYERSVGFSFPMLFSGYAEVREWFDDTDGRFHISVRVTNKFWGRLFGYSGAFDVEWLACPPSAVPPHVKPRREERRE